MAAFLYIPRRQPKPIQEVEQLGEEKQVEVVEEEGEMEGDSEEKQGEEVGLGGKEGIHSKIPAQTQSRRWRSTR